MKGKPHLSAKAAVLRRQAEARLRRQQRAHAQVQTGGDTKRLLHELQVHQIELEMQNEELSQASLKASSLLEKYTDLYDFAPVGYFSLDAQGRILEVNLTGAAMLGVARSRLVDRRFLLFVDTGYRSEFGAFLAAAFRSPDKQVCEMRLWKEDRIRFWADLEATAAVSSGGAARWCRMAVVDIASRKRAEEAQRRVDELAATNQRLEREIAQRQAAEAALQKSEQRSLQLLAESRHMQAQLRTLAHQILQVQEEERKQISRELHDEITQTLIGINVHLAALTNDTVINPGVVRRKLSHTLRLVEKSVEIVHQFARKLRPAQLDDLGLIPAIRSFMDVFPGRQGLIIRFTASARVENLDNDKRTMLYRVAQEALTNVGRHAQASRVLVSIAEIPEGVRMEISDDGKAFPVEQVLHPRKNRRLGLIGMRERVEMFGGDFSIESTPGKGTTVRVRVPFKNPRGT